MTQDEVLTKLNAMAIKIYNTLTKRKEVFKPIKEGQVGFYMCGMTVQDRPHVGHMRAFLTGDVIRRYLEYKGYKVNYVQNFTDIDDKIIERAKREGVDWRVIAERYIDEYIRNSDKLNIKRADVYPRAALHIQEIIEMVEMLLKRGFAYEAQGSVYYNVSRFADYGKLSGKRIDELIAGARVIPEPGKRNPLDFALWKAKKEGEPYWHSPFGPGRPGWHIECSVMSTHYLGQPFDIHGGGEDLVFPHHENEIAQAEGARGVEFAKYWVHVGFVRLKGEKMSKSTGLFSPIEEVLERYKPDALRLYLLQTHYRSPIDFQEDLLKSAEQALEGFMRLFSLVEPEESLGEDEWLKEYVIKFEEAMDDDFNTPKALAVIFELLSETNNYLSKGEKERAKAGSTLIALLMKVLGFKMEIEKKRDVEPLLQLLIEVRQKLREEKNYSLADKIRERLGSLGIVLEDTREGTIWRFES